MAGIVVGIDGSRHAGRALSWAMAEAAQRKSDLTVMTVSPVPASYWSAAPALQAGDADRVAEIRKYAAEAAARAEAELGAGRPASVSVVAFSGFPGRALIEASAKADLVVVGSRGSGLGALILGSVADQVVHHASCPVVVVPAGR